MEEPNNIIDESMGLRKVLLSELGVFVVPVVSLVSEPSVPWARFIAVKAAEQTKEKSMDVVLSNVNPLVLLRMRAKVSQVQLAMKSGVPQTSISSWENGRPVPEEAARKLAPHLDVDPDALVFASGIAAIKAKASEADPRSALYASQAAFELSQDTSLSQQQRDIAAKLCQGLLKTVEGALGIDGEAVGNLPVAEKSAEPDTGRDQFGRPTDPNRDLKISRGM